VPQDVSSSDIKFILRSITHQHILMDAENASETGDVVECLYVITLL
jgi:hypothetical protein